MRHSFFLHSEVILNTSPDGSHCDKSLKNNFHNVNTVKNRETQLKLFHIHVLIKIEIYVLIKIEKHVLIKIEKQPVAFMINNVTHVQSY